jgi:deoxyribodipyrimidine photo-lyase
LHAPEGTCFVMTNPPILLWLRRDLRLADQPALAAAVVSGAPVIPVYVLDDETPKHRRMGGAARWWLHHSLASLSRELEKLGSRLILRQGVCADVLARLGKETGAGSVHALHHYEPWWRNAEAAVARKLTLHLHHGNYLCPPGSMVSGAGTPYRIYTPFWRAMQRQLPPPEPLAAPKHISAPDHWPASERLEDWALLPVKPNWAAGFNDCWQPGEAGADHALADFADQAALYADRRNLPAEQGTSRLSPHLHHGEISPAVVWQAVARAGGSVGTYLGELGLWRTCRAGRLRQLSLAPRRGAGARFGRVAARAHRLPDRRCRDASAMGDRLDA